MGKKKSLPAVTYAGFPTEPKGLDKMLPDPTERKFFFIWLMRNESEHTKRAYFSDIALFTWFMNKQLGKKRLQDVEYEEIEMYRFGLISKCQSTGESINSVRRKIASVKSLYGYLHEQNIIARNVAAGIKPPREVETLHERILTKDEVRKMIECEGNLRNKLIIKFLYFTGMRVSEFTSAIWKDVRPGGEKLKPAISILGKGNKTRTVTFPKEVLEELLAQRNNPSDDEEPLVRSSRGGALDPSQVFRIVRGAAAKANINRPVSPHWFRHAHATHALSQGAPVHLVIHQLGHTSAEMTLRYCHIIGEEGSSDYISI